MKVSEIRKVIKAKLDTGLITEDEARYMNQRVSKIQARNDISWNHKAELYEVFA